MVNIHERRLQAAPAEVGALIDSLASDEDRLWPRGAWPPMRLDRPLGVGARGGHAFIRYEVEEYVPGERVVFRFDPRIGLAGTHRFELAPGPVLRHVLEGRAHGRTRLVWPLAIRWLHDACIEDALDRAESATGGEPAPRRWSPWVRLLRRAYSTPERPGLARMGISAGRSAGTRD